ncbi:ABC-three component system middle component 1 [Fulvivirga sp.]|uniref:ABC-three component system middle component 1 n=1 Tax=Fulvivirga sp. TaxID=1931237 RepID=UPI0032EB85DA
MKDSYHNIGEIFKNDFPETTIENSIVELEKGRAHCLFLKIPDEKFLHENWKGITNSIALNYQTHLETSFEKWNIYLFFLMSKELEELNLKYTIENNTFSSRKILEDASLSAEVLIKKHVNNELTIKEDTNRSGDTEFSHDPLIYSVLKDKKLKNKKILAKPLEEAYDQLITKIKGNS